MLPYFWGALKCQIGPISSDDWNPPSVHQLGTTKCWYYIPTWYYYLLVVYQVCHFYRLQRNSPVNLPFSASTHFPILTKQSSPASPDVVMKPVCSTAWIALSRTRRACDFYGLRRNGPGNPRYCFSSLLACQSDKRPGPDISLSWEITRWKFSSQDPAKEKTVDIWSFSTSCTQLERGSGEDHYC